MNRDLKLSGHMDIVAALTEINSRRLLTMGRRGGEAIELARAGLLRGSAHNQ